MKANERREILLREYSEDMLRHAAKLAALEEEEETERLLEQFACLPEPEFSEDFKKRMRSLLDETARQERRRKARSRRKPLLRAAACLLGVFVIGGSLMTMSSKGFLEHLKYLAGKSYSTHTEFGVTNQIPTYLKNALADGGWTEVLYPSYLPDDLELNDIACSKLRYELIFSNGKESFKMCVKAPNKNTSYLVDTEDAPGTEFYVKGEQASYVEKQDDRYLAFLYGGCIVSIESSSVNKLQMLDIADSLYSTALEP